MTEIPINMWSRDFIRWAFYNVFEMLSDELISEKAKDRTWINLIKIGLQRKKYTGFNLPERLKDFPLLMIALSKNNVDALMPVARSFPDQAIWYDPGNYVLEGNKLENRQLSKSLLTRIRFLILMIAWVIKADQQEREKLKYAFHEIASMLYLTESAKKILRNSGIKLILIANDHNYLSRMLAAVARGVGIGTGYIQHAQVTSIFPPLFTDYAFLEGFAAEHIYEKKSGDKTEIKRIGMVKRPQFRRPDNQDSGLQAIGWAGTFSFPTELMRSLIMEVQAVMPGIQMVYRPHPAQLPSLEITGVETSDSRNETSFEFLERIDVLITGNSGILLDAAISGVLPVYFFSDSFGSNWKDELFDKYLFDRNGVVRSVKSAEDLIRFLKESTAESRLKIRQEKFDASQYFSQFLKVKDKNPGIDILIDTVNEILELDK